MLTVHLALVSEVDGHDPADVSRVAAALARQATRDFAPIWGISPTVDAFPTLDDVPVGYWPMVVETDIKTPGAAGVHEDHNGQPFALIQMSDSWSLTASHEMLEMLADPFGRRTVPGQSPKEDQGRVEFLVEVCDPCEADDFAYTVNDVLMSDFYTPRFFDPTTESCVRYDYTGSLDQPRDIKQGGYLSWHEPVSNHWWQKIWFGPEADYRDLGVFDASAGSVRSWVDSQTEHPGIDQGLDKANATLKAAVAAGEGTAKSAGSRAEALRGQIQEILSGS